MTGDRITGPAVVALRRALSVVLGHETEIARWTLPGDVGGDEFVAAARRHRVETHLVAHLERLDLPAAVETALDAQALSQRLASLRLARDTCRASALLHDAGVRHLAFKGVALAQQAFGDFSARGFGDIDLLVHPADVATAHRTLTGSGRWTSHPAWPTPDESWAWRTQLRHHFSLCLTGACDLDLQWRLHPVVGEGQRFDDAWRRRVTVELSGHPVDTLGPYDALAHSSSHATRDTWSWLRSLVDVHQLVAQRSTWLDADRPLSRAQLLSVGIAVRAFGRPPIAPSVVDHAVALAARWWPEVLARQAAPPVVVTPDGPPGQAFLAMSRRYLLGTRHPAGAVNALAGLVLRQDLLGGLGQESAHSAVVAFVRRRAWRVVSQVSPSAGS